MSGQGRGHSRAIKEDSFIGRHVGQQPDLAATVRAGDPAPDGSGPLELARGVEIGHIFQLGRKYAAALDLRVLDENGNVDVSKAQPITFDPFNNTYVVLGETVAKAFSAGNSLK